MTRRGPLLLAGLCGLFLIPPVGGADPVSKLSSRYRLEAEIRKEGAPRALVIDAFHEATANRLYYATVDHKALAMMRCEVPATVKEVVRPKWVRRFDLPVRGWDEKEIDKDTSKVLVEVFRDNATGFLIYASEAGGLAVLDAPPGANFRAVAPRWLYRLQLKIRPSGENDFTRNYLKLNVEVYLHEPTGHLLYVGHNGALAVVATKKDFRDLKPKPATWVQGLVPRARKFDEQEFTQNTAQISLEVYQDENAGTVLYATESLTLAAIPGVWNKRDVNGNGLAFRYQLLSGKFTAESFFHANTGNMLVVTDAGGLAVVPGEPRPGR